MHWTQIMYLGESMVRLSFSVRRFVAAIVVTSLAVVGLTVWETPKADAASIQQAGPTAANPDRIDWPVRADVNADGRQSGGGLPSES